MVGNPLSLTPRLDHKEIVLSFNSLVMKQTCLEILLLPFKWGSLCGCGTGREKQIAHLLNAKSLPPYLLLLNVNS